MDNVTTSPVAEWSKAIHNLDLEHVQKLLSTSPDLLWESIAIPETEEHAHLVEQLEQFQLLGKTLTNLAAIPYLLLDFDDEILQQHKRTRLFEFLLSHATPDDLNTRSWGSCGNKTMHLAAFMGHGQPELEAHGAWTMVANDLGHLPPKTPRFIKNNTSAAFRLRKPNEKPKSGSEEELLKHQTQRKQDIDLLAKRSAVKNNPLFKKFEQQQQQQQQQHPASSSSQARTLGVPDNDKVDLIRKNSKVINSLKTKSYVTTSVFRQNAATASPPVAPRTSPTPAPRKIKSVPEAIKPVDSAAPAPAPAQAAPATQPSSSTRDSAEADEPSQLTETKIKEETQPSPAAAEPSPADLKIEKDLETSGSQHPPFLPPTDRSVGKPRLNKAALPPPPLAIVTTPGALASPDSPTLEPESHQQLVDNHKQRELQKQILDTTTDENKNASQLRNENKNKHEDEHHAFDIFAEPGSPQQAVLKEESSSTESSPCISYSGNANKVAQSMQSTVVARLSPVSLENHDPGVLKKAEIDETTTPIASQPLERESPLTMDKYDKNKIGFDHWYESYEAWDDGLYESMSSSSSSSSPLQSEHPSGLKEELDENSVASATPPASFSPQQRLSTGTESVDTLPPPSVKDAVGNDDIPVTTDISLAPSSRAEEYGSIAVQSTSFYANHGEDDPTKVRSSLSDQPSLRHSVEGLATDSDSDSDSDSVYSYIDTKVEIDSDQMHCAASSASHNSLHLDFKETPPLKLDDRLVGRMADDDDDGDDDKSKQSQQYYYINAPYPSTDLYDSRQIQQQQQQQQRSYSKDELMSLRQEQQGFDDTLYRHHRQSAGKYDTYQDQHDVNDNDERVYNNCYGYDDEYRPLSAKLELPEVVNHPGQSTSAFGKLYVRVSSAENILLPLPDQTAYVRIVVSDGEYEFMSRYEELGPKVLFDYECIMDARPDMIVTLAIHVRPDSHVKPKTGLTKWFTPTYYNQREILAGYVHPDDGAIGQSRFALGHMIQACNQKVYGTSFDCFNSWYTRTSRERHLEQLGHDDILKVVASLSIEMLYLPLTDPSLVRESSSSSSSTTSQIPILLMTLRCSPFL
ncbi:hypothetical protein BX666DRAFT_893576 [Dichotomocladium elegans]|nr:hypothetical protein BX666DRAFT_893576 [Dichotomocladium elegans]